MDDFDYMLLLVVISAPLSLFLMLLFSTDGISDDQRDWIETNIEENYSVRDAEVKFPDGAPDREDEKLTLFTVEGVSESEYHTIEVEGYLDFDEQVVIIGDDLDGAVVPVEDSDAARVLTDSTGV